MTPGTDVAHGQEILCGQECGCGLHDGARQVQQCGLQVQESSLRIQNNLNELTSLDRQDGG